MNKFLLEAKLQDGQIITATTPELKGSEARQWSNAGRALRKLLAGRPYRETHITLVPPGQETPVRRRFDESNDVPGDLGWIRH